MSEKDDEKEEESCDCEYGFVLAVVFILGLFFLFSGDPDVWDGLRAKAMASLPTPQQVEK